MRRAPPTRLSHSWELAQNAPSMPERIVLVGMMGAGKTSVGTELAGILGWQYWDNDTALQRDTGRDARSLVDSIGVDKAHEEETRVLLDALSTLDRAVIAAAGSVVMNPRAVEALHHEWVVWLRAEVETLAQRVRGGTHRPFMDAEVELTLHQLDAQRRGAYQGVARVVVDVDHITPRQAAEQVAARWWSDAKSR
jgi:shikimate kinase